MSDELSFVATACLQATLWLGLGLFLSRLLSRRPALAHRVLLLAVGGALLTPAATLLVREAGWGLLPAPPAQAAPPAFSSPVTASIPLDLAVVEGETRPETVSEEAGPVVADRVSGASTRTITVSGAASLLWAVATLCLLGRLLVAAASAVRVARSTRAVADRSLRSAVWRAGRVRGLKRVPMVRSSPRVRSPMVWGWSRHPVLLVPEGGLGDPALWPPLIDHEIAHLVRRDHLAAIFAELLVCILPWHPFAWSARRRIHRLCERACDDWVLGQGHLASDYAESLLGVAVLSRAALNPAAVGHRSGLSGRIRRILNSKRTPRRPGRAWSVATLVCVLGIAVAALAQEGAPRAAEELPVGRMTTPIRHASPDKGGDRLDAYLVETSEELERLREERGDVADWAGRSDELSGRLAGTRAIPAATGRELHVVGVYEGVYAPGVGHHSFGSVTVRVTRGGAPIVLALSSYEPVDWNVVVGPGVVLEKVLVGGYYRQRVEGIGDTPLVVQTYQDDKVIPFRAYEKDGSGYAHACRTLGEMTGLDVASFQGRYAANDGGFEVGPGSRAFRAEMLRASIHDLWLEVLADRHARLREHYGKLDFHAVRVRGLARLWTSLTPLGPAGEKGVVLPPALNHVVHDANGRRFYALTDHDLFTFESGERTMRRVDLGHDVAALSWSHGLALDTKRRRLVIATGSTSERLQSLDLDTGTWFHFPDPDQARVHALVYDGARDAVHALSLEPREGTFLVTYSAEGRLLRKVRLSHDLGLVRADLVQLAVAGDHLVVLSSPSGEGLVNIEPRTQCLVVELETGRVVYNVLQR